MALQKVGIAMSGGVDSSVSASLLKQRGFIVHGFFMVLPLPGAERLAQRVQTVADCLGIPLHCVDMEGFFSRSVINYFLRTYREGNTPNPCIICNRRIKFGVLMQMMRDRGMDKMATGHYARIKNTPDGIPLLQRSCDPKKDQSYFLCRLSSDQLEKTIFPLGDLTKEEVYGLAAEMHLSTLHGPESQDICFLAGESVAAFFARQGITDKPGKIINTEGQTIGRHRGLWHYTVGQRRGLGLPDATPWYVQRLDGQNNSLTVCKKDGLYTGKMVVSDVAWSAAPACTPWRGLVQIRGRHEASPATVTAGKNGNWLVTFQTGQKAVSPGQFAVFYRDDTVEGSGIITGLTADGDSRP